MVTTKHMWLSNTWLLSLVQLFAAPQTVARQASLSVGFSRQGYWSALPFPSPEDLPDPENEPRFPAFNADSLPSKPPGKPPNLPYVPYLIPEPTSLTLCPFLLLCF